MFSILLKDKVKVSRDKLMEYLKNDGIETRPVFYPLHIMPPYEEAEGEYPVAEKLSRNGINLPTHALLKEEDIAYISKKIKKYCEYNDLN